MWIDLFLRKRDALSGQKKAAPTRNTGPVTRPVIGRILQGRRHRTGTPVFWFASRKFLKHRFLNEANPSGRTTFTTHGQACLILVMRPRSRSKNFGQLSMRGSLNWECRRSSSMNGISIINQGSVRNTGGSISHYGFKKTRNFCKPSKKEKLWPPINQKHPPKNLNPSCSTTP